MSRSAHSSRLVEPFWCFNELVSSSSSSCELGSMMCVVELVIERLSGEESEWLEGESG